MNKKNIFILMSLLLLSGCQSKNTYKEDTFQSVYIKKDENCNKEVKLYYTDSKDVNYYTMCLTEIILKFENKELELKEALKNDLEKKLSLIEDKESDEYLKTDSDLRIIDIILNPVKPELWLDSSIDDFYKFDNSKELKHVKVKNYKHMGKISFPISQ